MTIYEALKKDHVKVLGLIDKLIDSEKADSTARNALIDEIRDELIPHSRAEEAVLYNSIRDTGLDKSLVAHGYGEHMEAESLLRTLQVTGAVHVTWVAGAKKLKEALKHHIHEEETKIFEAAKQLFIDEEAESMAEVFNQMKPLVKNQGIVGSSMDLMVNIMPSRLRETFSKFMTAKPESKSA